MLKPKKLTSLLIAFFMGITFLNAQTPQTTEATDVSDKELTTFVAAFQQVQVINQQAQQNMVKAVQDEELSIERFNEMKQNEQNPNQEIQGTTEEMEQFDKANQQIVQIQKQATQSMQKKIEDEGLTIQRYQEIAMALQKSPELQQKIQKMMQNQ